MFRRTGIKRQLGIASLVLAVGCKGQILVNISPSESDRGPGENKTDAASSSTDGGRVDGSKLERDGSNGQLDAGGGSIEQPKDAGVQLRYPDVHDPNDSPPVIGGPGCGFDTAAFCDTFGAPSTVRGRAGEMDSVFWSAGRMMGQFSQTRAIPIGLGSIPQCRPDVPGAILPPNDALICNPVDDVKSHHLLLAAAAQNYGQHGFRVRQPFDFAGRTGKIVFDASADPLSTLHGWLSLAITEDPIATPGYALVGNDEGSLIPKNAVEIHFANAGGESELTVRHIHVFKNYADTAYEAPSSLTHAKHAWGKLNHYEVLVSKSSIEIRVTPYSEDGTSFAPATLIHKQALDLPFTRGYVHLSLHNHATIKYTQPEANNTWGVINASVARVDNVGFDGPVITAWREYEVPDSLVKFKDRGFLTGNDPKNPEGEGIDIGYVVADTANTPKQKFTLKGVDLSRVTRARIAVLLWADMHTAQGTPANYTLRARLNGKAWRDRKLSPEEAAFAKPGPTVRDPEGQPIGDPATQGRLGLTIDVPLEDLVAGDNTLEFVTANIPPGYPPVVSNIDLVFNLN